ncbi:hypothetical protein G6011_03557 [Alternaria panax]|uniref:Uncharacterized protein n=1 Tax=Alternaria panax TaxID=48097 RepID=A0AAD4NSZ9_9PLEO|nr:hypothetical protein G6011_03557 [Alternaria panax]
MKLLMGALPLKNPRLHWKPEVVGPALQQVFLIGAVRLKFFRPGSAQEIDVVIAVAILKAYLNRNSAVKERLMRVSIRQEDDALEDGPTPMWPDNPVAEGGGAGMYANVYAYTCVLSDLLKPLLILLSKFKVDAMFSPQFPEGSPAAKCLVESADISYTCTLDASLEGVKPNMGLGSMVLMEDVDRENYCKPKGILSWSGLPDLQWNVNRESGMALLFATQVIPSEDRKMWGLVARFESAVWRHLEAYNRRFSDIDAGSTMLLSRLSYFLQDLAPSFSPTVNRVDRQDEPAASGTDADQPSLVHQKITVMVCDKCGDAHDDPSTYQAKDLEAHCRSSPSVHMNDNKSRDDCDEDKYPRARGTGPTAFPFMRLPIDLRLCIYDRLAAMPEAYSITERGHIQMCPSLSFRIIDVGGDQMYGYMFWIETISYMLKIRLIAVMEQERAYCGPLNEFYSSTLVTLSHWIDEHFTNDDPEECEKNPCEKVCIIFEFFKRAIWSLYQGNKIELRIIMAGGYLRQRYPDWSWTDSVEAFIDLTAACPFPESIMLRFLVPADCIAYTRKISSVPNRLGSRLSSKVFRIDVLQDDDDLLAL